MRKWSAYAVVICTEPICTGSKYLGEVTADTREQAIEQVADLGDSISLCWQCAREIEDPTVTEIIVEEAK